MANDIWPLWLKYMTQHSDTASRDIILKKIKSFFKHFYTNFEIKEDDEEGIRSCDLIETKI